MQVIGHEGGLKMGSSLRRADWLPRKRSWLVRERSMFFVVNGSFTALPELKFIWFGLAHR